MIRPLPIVLLGLAGGIIAAGCSSGGSGGAGGGGFALDSGRYQYVITQAQPNTCWSPSKNVPQLPLTLDPQLSVNGSQVVVTTTAGGITTTFDLTKSGNSLSGGSSGDIDLNPQGVACVLHVDGTFAGTLTTNDAFDATQVINVSEKSGTGCSVLIGTVSPQFDTLPCSLTTTGHATRQ